jgi:hypothetical protein
MSNRRSNIRDRYRVFRNSNNIQNLGLTRRNNPDEEHPPEEPRVINRQRFTVWLSAAVYSFAITVILVWYFDYYFSTDSSDNLQSSELEEVIVEQSSDPHREQTEPGDGIID